VVWHKCHIFPRLKGGTMIRTFITSNSKPLAPEAVARMIATFKRLNPHLCDDVEDARQDGFASPAGHGELPSESTTDNGWD